MSSKLFLCGLFEQELVDKGIMKPGHCVDCLHLDWKGKDFCDKKKEFIEERLTDCKDWVIDTR